MRAWCIYAAVFVLYKGDEFTKDGTALLYMLTMLHDNNAFDTVFGEIPTDATASSEATPQTYSRGSVKPAKMPQLDVAALLNAPMIKIARSKDEDDLTAAEAKKVRAELAALAEKQIDEDMEKLMGLTDKLTGIDKSTRTGTYRMIMSRRETLKTASGTASGTGPGPKVGERQFRTAEFTFACA